MPEGYCAVVFAYHNGVPSRHMAVCKYVLSAKRIYHRQAWSIAKMHATCVAGVGQLTIEYIVHMVKVRTQISIISFVSLSQSSRLEVSTVLVHMDFKASEVIS